MSATAVDNFLSTLSTRTSPDLMQRVLNQSTTTHVNTYILDAETERRHLFSRCYSVPFSCSYCR